MKDNKIVGLILTFNEEVNIVNCIESLRFCNKIVVFDSYSTDKTKELSIISGAKVLEREFDNYAAQRNAAINSISDEFDWILMIDADERIDPSLKDEINYVIKTSKIIFYDF